MKFWVKYPFSATTHCPIIDSVMPLFTVYWNLQHHFLILTRAHCKLFSWKLASYHHWLHLCQIKFLKRFISRFFILFTFLELHFYGIWGFWGEGKNLMYRKKIIIYRSEDRWDLKHNYKLEIRRDERKITWKGLPKLKCASYRSQNF